MIAKKLSQKGLGILQSNTKTQTHFNIFSHFCVNPKVYNLSRYYLFSQFYVKWIKNYYNLNSFCIAHIIKNFNISKHFTSNFVDINWILQSNNFT